jgi:hypothetical protein
MMSGYNLTPIREYTDHFAGCQALSPAIFRAVRVFNQIEPHLDTIAWRQVD